MDKTQFDNVSHALVRIAMAHNLDIEFKPNYNDEVAFVIDFNTEAVDYETLENPTCTSVASYLVITMPKVVYEDETKQGEKNKYDDFIVFDMINQYHHIASKLMEAAKPQYLLGVQDGHVDKLMWCVWN